MYIEKTFKLFCALFPLIYLFITFLAIISSELKYTIKIIKLIKRLNLFFSTF